MWHSAVTTTPLTGGCTAVAVVLGMLGLYLDSLAALAGAMGLAALLCVAASLFVYRAARAADGLRVEREITAGTIYRGAPVEVTVRATVPPVPGLQLRMSDLPPRSTIYEPDEAVLHNGTGRYQVRFMSPGEVSFAGLVLEAADRFFSMTFVCSAPRYGREKFSVHPVASSNSDPAAEGGAGTKERTKVGLLQGESIRGFRPFRQGDDPARIDWKLTAKHGEPFVRVTASGAGGPPLVVVDLAFPEADEDSAIRSAAGDEIGRVMRENGQCSLLLISGGEVIEYRYHERDIMRLLRLLDLHLPVPAHHIYRVEDPIVLMERLRRAEQGLLLPTRRYATVLSTVLRRRVKSEFERQIDRIIAGSEHRDLIVYTSSADVSHLNLIAAVARRRRRRLLIRLPRPKAGSIPRLSPYPRVEAI